MSAAIVDEERLDRGPNAEYHGLVIHDEAEDLDAHGAVEPLFMAILIVFHTSSPSWLVKSGKTWPSTPKWSMVSSLRPRQRV